MKNRSACRPLALLLAAAFIFTSGCSSFVARSTKEPSESETETEPSGSGSAFDSLAEDEYKEEDLALYSSFEGVPDEITVRFYSGMPSVPYIGIAQYKELVQDETLSVESDGGCLILTAGNGASVIADPEADTLTSDRWAEFRIDQESFNSDKVAGFRDQNAPFVMIESAEFEPQKEPLVFDFAEYEIPLYTDEQDVYLPLAMVNELMTDVAFTTLAYNEENVYLYNGFEVLSMSDIDPDYYQRFADGTPRDPDMAEYAYHQLCFSLDKLYGCTGSAPLDNSIAEIGLDRALLETDEYTAMIREMLLSTDRDIYNAGLFFLSIYMTDPHNSMYNEDLYNILLVKDPKWISENISEPLTGVMETDSYALALLRDFFTSDVREDREEVFGDTLSYHEQGDTAVITLDNFTECDEDGWFSYYRGEGPMPEDDNVGTVVAGIERAKENPEIRNVILDVSNNSGGSNDLMMTIVALITGGADCKCYDRTTGQYYILHYVIDSRFDGSFDTSAAYDDTDLNFAILTSHNSFSCGNAVISLLKDAGVPVFGEISGGGTCMVRSLALPEGPVFMISSPFAVMVNWDGDMIENGIPVDSYLVTESEDGSLDYTGLFDIDKLSGLMSEYYEVVLEETT